MDSNKSRAKAAVGLCKRCGKVSGKQKLGSLTSWLFQSSVCQCEFVQKLQSQRDSADAAVTKEFGGDIANLPELGARFSVLERIGTGGMGSVYRAVDEKNNSAVAIKVLHDSLKVDKQAVSRFEQEAEAIVSLSHDYLVKALLFDSTENGVPYLVMEFVDGEPLDKILKREIFMEARDAVDIFVKVCSGLGHAHQNRIIHRDLKPGNIIVTTNAQGEKSAKLVDFGIAKVCTMSDRAAINLTQTGEVFGSPHYMSPEQCLGFELDSRSDIYSLGCVMYECLSGKPPFDGENPVQLIAKHLSAEVPPLRICDESMGVKFNQALAEIVAKCLAKEPSERFGSAEMLSRNLTQILLAAEGSERAQGFLNRRIDFARGAFLVSVVLSFACLTLLAIPPDESQKAFLSWLLVLPIAACILASILIVERMRHLLNSAQFQPRASRNTAGNSINVLSMCLGLAVFCLASSIGCASIEESQVAIVYFTASVAIVLSLSVWAASLQGYAGRDIEGNIQAGKGLCLVALLLLCGLVIVHYLNYQSKCEQQPSQSVANGEVTDELGALLDPSEASGFTQQKISAIETTPKGTYRVFNFPPGVQLGKFLNWAETGGYHARGRLRIPANQKLVLNIDQQACATFAPLLLKLRPDDISELVFQRSNIQTPGNPYADDVLFYISRWTDLEILDASDTDVSDFGLSKCEKFKKLKGLYLTGTQVSAEKLTEFPPLLDLQALDVSQIQGVHPLLSKLKESRALRMLSINSSSLKNTDITEIAKIPNLVGLSISDNKDIDDEAMRFISGLPHLQYLFIRGTGISSKSLPYLQGLKELKELEYDLSTWQGKEVLLQQTMPNCRLYGSKERIFLETGLRFRSLMTRYIKTLGGFLR